MREILFRGKRLDNGEWAYGYLFSDTAPCSLKPVGKCCCPHDGSYAEILMWEDEFHEYNSFQVKSETVGQYIGLRDKNGQRIFEGDILKGFQYPFLDDEGSHNYYAKICWFDNSPAFGIVTVKNPKSKVRGISEGNADYLENFKSELWEVIGNVHDNPELIKGVLDDE